MDQVGGEDYEAEQLEEFALPALELLAQKE